MQSIDHFDQYESAFSTRYASQKMRHLFSARFKYSTWRRLWTALAEVQKDLGLDITAVQISEMGAHCEDIDFAAVDKYENEFHHDVMAHIHAYGDQCPRARPVIHLGATSCFVTDNGDIIQMRDALVLIRNQLQQVILQLSKFAKAHAELPCLGFTHFQPAQLTTVGKRACLWIQDFLIDEQEVDFRIRNMRFLGAKGATGTQASFLALFRGNQEKVKELDRRVAEKMGFMNPYLIASQTYPRKLDALIVNALTGIATSAHKFATDIRLLAHLKEIEEPFGERQIGSSAMPYKRNPMLSERICGLARFLISLNDNPSYTASLQWLERTLDDSANRRLVLPKAFLTADAILTLLLHLTKNLVVNPAVIARHVSEELPFMATENILMSAVQKGGDRQALHERLRVHSQAAAEAIKKEGSKNDLLQRITEDSDFNLTEKEMEKLMNVQAFIGRSPEQVYEFLKTEVKMEK